MAGPPEGFRLAATAVMALAAAAMLVGMASVSSEAGSS
jgi:hypothetical protein